VTHKETVGKASTRQSGRGVTEKKRERVEGGRGEEKRKGERLTLSPGE